LSFFTAILLADDPMVLHAGSGRDENDKIWDALALVGSRFKVKVKVRVAIEKLCPQFLDFSS
jgi:hypothetical protein